MGNFHSKIDAENGFNLGHLLLDGTENAGSVIPHAHGTRIYQPESHQRVPSAGFGVQHVVMSTRAAVINFAKPINLYQLLLGKRRMGFRLFLFEEPPNAECLGDQANGFNRVPASMSYEILPKINSQQNSPFKEIGNSVSFANARTIFR